MTQAYNLSQLANNLNSSGQLDATDGLVNAVPIANGGTGASNASAARTNLGLGTIATQSANSVAITGGSISGITDLAVVDGGTGASTASAARTNLGLVIGTDIPSPTGAGASGTWGINITGTAANVTSGFGYNQVWTTYSPNVDRLSGTTYTNSTGKPIMVSVGVNAVFSSPRVTGVVGGITVYDYNFPYGTGVQVTMVVPNGLTYSVTIVSGTTFQYWVELR